MASIKRPILTIAIPTYNRAGLLKHSLSRIGQAIIGNESLIEIVISDNCSDDNTEAIVKEAQESFPIKYFKNSENVGFNFNYIKLINEHAKGEFCWVLGDDDFIHQSAITKIVSVLLMNKDVSFIYANYNFRSLTEILQETENNALFLDKGDMPVDGILCSFEELLSKAVGIGNLLLTFISSAVFKTDLIRDLDKSNISKESWTTFYNLFPHSYFYAMTMRGKKAYFLNAPVLTAVIHTKSWSSNLWLLYLKFIPELYDFYLKNGFTKLSLRNHEKLIIRSGIPFLFKASFLNKHCFKVLCGFLFRYVYDLHFHFSLIVLLKNKLTSRSLFRSR